VPRLINRICDRALSQGYLRRAATIDLEILEAAMPDRDQRAAVHPAAPPLSVSPPQRPVPPSVPDSRLAASQDPISDWLACAEEKALPLATAQELAPSPRAGVVVGPTISIPLLPGAAGDRRPASPRLDFVPRTHMQRTMSRWGRRFGIASLWLMGVLGVALGAGAVWTISTDMATPVVFPALPPERPIWIAPPPEVPRSPDNLLLDVPAAGLGAAAAR
jgi:hypothetical protein